MLTLGVRVGDYIMIDDNIRIEIIKAGPSVFRLGIEAPKDMCILRSSLYEQTNPESISDAQIAPVNAVS